MKKRFPSLFDIVLLLLVIGAVAVSGMLAENNGQKMPGDVSLLTEELRITTQRYTDWEKFNAPEQYIQTYVLRFAGDAARHPEDWPEPGAQILSEYGAHPLLGDLKELKVVSDDPENPVLEATVSCFCNYYKTAILTPDTEYLRLGDEKPCRLATGEYLGMGTIVKMN